jgi:hypothetical protein
VSAPETQQRLPCYWGLWERLKGGAAVDLDHDRDNFLLWFEGDPLGNNNALVAERRSDLSRRKFGPGYSSESVARCLDHLAKGWDSPQVPRYRPFAEKHNTKEEDFCDTRKRD